MATRPQALAVALVQRLAVARENCLLRRCSGRSSEPDVFDLATRSAEVLASFVVSYLVDGLLDPRFEFLVLGHP